MAEDRGDERIARRLAIQHSVSVDAVRTVLRALRAGGGTMAQFSHPEFGGMSQWSSGMTMVGDMFNDRLKATLNALCTDLASYIRDAGPSSSSAGARTERPEASYRSSGPTPRSGWWPAGLGEPSSVGAQNQLRYAAFPTSRRLVIDDHGRLTVYDMGDHVISGVAQAQSSDQTITFTSQHGLVSIADLPVVDQKE
jgi:hypothetical protein